VKRTGTQRRAFELEDQHPKLRPFLSTKRKHLKISGEENKQTNVPSTPKDQTLKSRPSLLTRRKHLTVLEEENKHKKVPLTLKTGLSSQRSRLSSRKPTPENED